MAETIKHRSKKSAAERINLDDWGNAGALDGLLSFLNITPEQAPVNQGPTKVLNLLEQRQRLEQSLPVIDTVSITDRVPDIDGTPRTASPAMAAASHPSLFPTPSLPVIDTLPVIDKNRDKTITGTLPVIDTPAWRHPKQEAGFGNKRLYRCTLAQDGHSHTEEALYQALWRSGSPESDDTRLTIMGYGEMAKRVRLSFNNTKYACQRLIAKLAIEEVAREVSDRRQGKTYRVFSYRAILEHRKEAGLEWVIRNKGVEFVSPLLASAPPITDPLPVIDENAPITGTPTLSISGRGSLSISGRGSLSITGTPLGNSFRKASRKEETSSSSSPDAASILQALSDYGQPDDDVAATLLSRCRIVVPDCSVTEIVHFVHQKGALIRQDRSGRITSPMGFLLTAVPKCFTGETFECYRQQEQKRQEEQRATRERQEAEIEQWRREQESVLMDENASEDDKRFARQILGIE
jgi:hypothetical protein